VAYNWDDPDKGDICPDKEEAVFLENQDHFLFLVVLHQEAMEDS
jgi:hypothetical protein